MFSDGNYERPGINPRPLLSENQYRWPISSISEEFPRERTWIEINRTSLNHNIAVLSALSSNHHEQLGLVIKANAYGHGLAEIALIAEDNTNVGWLFTVGLKEAVMLRNTGITKPLLVLGYIDAEPEQAIIHDIHLPLFDKISAQALNACAQRCGKKIKVHIKVDTGLSRLGILPEDVISFVQEMQQLPFLNIYGIYTHLADTNDQDQTFTHKQLDAFDNLLELLTSLSINIPCTHAIPSGALALRLKRRYTTTRIGTNLYGLWKSEINEQRTLERYPRTQLLPLLTWKTTITQIKQVPRDTPLGYSCTYVTKRRTTLAVLPVGYWDGYPRELSNNACVMINNQYAPIRGIISMNMMMVDVTDIPGITTHMPVTLIGQAPDINATDLARKLDMLNYGLLTLINPSIKRFLIDQQF